MPSFPPELSLHEHARHPDVLLPVNGLAHDVIAGDDIEADVGREFVQDLCDDIKQKPGLKLWRHHLDGGEAYVTAVEQRFPNCRLAGPRVVSEHRNVQARVCYTH